MGNSREFAEFACETFFIFEVFFKGDVSEVKNGSYHTKEIGFLLIGKTYFVHGLLQDTVTLGILQGRVVEGGRVEVLGKGQKGLRY